MDPKKTRLVNYFIDANPDGLDKSKLYSLPERRLIEINVLWQYFKFGKSYGEIATKFGINKRRVRFIVTGK